MAVMIHAELGLAKASNLSRRSVHSTLPIISSALGEEMPATRPLHERFMEKVSPCPVTGCWWWTAAVMHSGYGQIGIRMPRKIELAHRVSYELFVGPIVGALWVLHSCNNGHLGCVNPGHLRLGSRAENMSDMARAGSVKGARHGMAKLDDAAVQMIRTRTDLGSRELAERFGVSRSLVTMVRARAIWTHVE